MTSTPHGSIFIHRCRRPAARNRSSRLAVTVRGEIFGGINWKCNETERTLKRKCLWARKRKKSPRQLNFLSTLCLYPSLPPVIPRAKCLCCLRHRIRAHNPVYPGWTGSCGFLFIPHYTAALISANDQSAVSCRAQQFPFSGPTHTHTKKNFLSERFLGARIMMHSESFRWLVWDVAPRKAQTFRMLLSNWAKQGAVRFSFWLQN